MRYLLLTLNDLSPEEIFRLNAMMPYRAIFVTKERSEYDVVGLLLREKDEPLMFRRAIHIIYRSERAKHFFSDVTSTKTWIQTARHSYEELPD